VKKKRIGKKEETNDGLTISESLKEKLFSKSRSPSRERSKQKGVMKVPEDDVPPAVPGGGSGGGSDIMSPPHSPRESRGRKSRSPSRERKGKISKKNDFGDIEELTVKRPASPSPSRARHKGLAKTEDNVEKPKVKKRPLRSKSVESFVNSTIDNRNRRDTDPDVQERPDPREMAKARGKARGLLKKKSYYGKDKDSERTTMTESRNSQREREEAAALERNEDALKSKTTDDSIQLKKRYLRIGSTDPSPKSKFDLGKTDRANLKTGPSESKSDKTPTKDLKQQPKITDSPTPKVSKVSFEHRLEEDKVSHELKLSRAHQEMKKFLENKPQPANEQEFNAMHMNLQRRASSQKRIGKGSVFSVFATDGSDTSEGEHNHNDEFPSPNSNGLMVFGNQDNQVFRVYDHQPPGKDSKD